MTGPDVAQDLVAAQTGNPVTEATAVRSGVNTSYKVSTDDDQYFIKFGTETDESLLAEAAILRNLCDVVPVPSVVAAGMTDSSTEYFITEWIAGTQTNYALGAGEEWLATELGRNLALIHSERSLPAGYVCSDDGEEISVDAREWETLFNAWLLRYAEDVKKNYSGIGSDLIRLIHWCEMPELDDSGVLTPLDYHGGNVLTSDEQVAAFIDFERCYSGHPAWSFSVSKRVIGREDGALADAFESGYESVCPLPEEHPAFKIAGMIRELRMAHMLFDNPADRRSVYADEVASIEESLRS